MRKVAAYVLFLIAVLNLHAEERIAPTKEFLVQIDLSRFKYSNNLGCLDVSFGVYPSRLTFIKRNDSLEGCVGFNIKAWKLPDDSLVLQSALMLPISLPDTTVISHEMSFVGKAKLMLPPGDYKCLIRLKDKNDTKREDSAYFKVTFERFDSSCSVSDVVLCSNIVESQRKENIFYRNSYEVIPNTDLLFGLPKKPVVYAYSELYNLELNKTYVLNTQIINMQNKIFKQNKRIRQYSAVNSVDVTTLNIASIASGKYRFQLILTDTLGNEYDRSGKNFFIYNPGIMEPNVSPTLAKSAEYAGLSNDELIEEFNQSRFLATTTDIEMFEKLSTEEARRAFLVLFWTDIENGKRGGIEVTRAIYQQRLSIANQRYRSLGRDGWRTDRGRIFVLFGEPDEIDRTPSSDNAKPSEVWRYNQIESGVIFVFVDRTGFGEYTLVHSTKRGELQDEGWERNLQ